MSDPAPPLILCVDDEPQVLDGLKLSLRKRFTVLSASGGEEALKLLEHQHPQVVVSDMRMAGMNGAVFLSQVRQKYPDISRILLTGQADLMSAIAAVNEGQVFRFLTKPCPPPALSAAVDGGVEQHRLVTGERVLLEQTLRGSIRTLTDVLALTHPHAFGRANRLRQRLSALADVMQVSEKWQIEVAAMLSELGMVSLPDALPERAQRKQPLTPEESQMIAGVPQVTDQLLSHIPRLEVVRAILSQRVNIDLSMPSLSIPDQKRALLGARMLRAAAELDDLETQGFGPREALEALSRRKEGGHDVSILQGLAQVLEAGSDPTTVQQLSLRELRAGMICLEDIRLTAGAVLVARGFEITESFVARAKNFDAGAVKEPIRVSVRNSEVAKAGIAA